jgi:hypothetical protein
MVVGVNMSKRWCNKFIPIMKGHMNIPSSWQRETHPLRVFLRYSDLGICHTVVYQVLSSLLVFHDTVRSFTPPHMADAWQRHSIYWRVLPWLTLLTANCLVELCNLYLASISMRPPWWPKTSPQLDLLLVQHSEHYGCTDSRHIWCAMQKQP